MSEREVRELQARYAQILDAQQFDEPTLDYAVLASHVEAIERFGALSGSMITIFDHFRKRHVYASPNHGGVFGFEPVAWDEGHAVDFDVAIHPDDFCHVMRNGVACMSHFFVGNKNALRHKLVREYRVAVKGVYKRVTEQIQVLQTDPSGNIWLALCLMDISPDQNPPYTVNSQLIDCLTGDIITPVDALYDCKPLLSGREVEILKLVDAGRLSKEIADQLSISVHTVNTHRQRILEKLRVGTSIEAIRYASALGLLGD